MLSITIGVCAYNEEKNIEKLLRSLSRQKTDDGIMIQEIIVVSSACMDRTDNIVRSFMKKDKKLRFFTQEKREGKASAVNIILSNAVGDIIVLAGADIVLPCGTINKLVSPFYDKNIGMTGGHPVPVDSKKTFIGFTSHLLWELHHKLALRDPKLGEIVAFKNIINEIPANTAVDEASLEAIVTANGFRIVYVPDAVVFNKGPSTISDFLRQRRRIYAGHLHLQKSSGYSTSSMSAANLIAIIFSSISFNSKEIFWTMGAVILEGYGRFLGMYDYYILKKNPYIWDMINTTKEVA